MPDGISAPVLGVGARVQLLALPEWLTHDLPESEQRELQNFIGQTSVVTEIDSGGYYWIGFGQTVDGEEDARYSGHSFCVTAECLQLV